MDANDEFDGLDDDDLLTAAVVGSCDHRVPANGLDSTFEPSPRPDKRRRISGHTGLKGVNGTTGHAVNNRNVNGNGTSTSIDINRMSGNKTGMETRPYRTLAKTSSSSSLSGMLGAGARNAKSNGSVHYASAAAARSQSLQESVNGGNATTVNGNIEQSIDASTLANPEDNLSQLNENDFIYISSQLTASQSRSQGTKVTNNNFRQTTLFGSGSVQRLPSHSTRRPNWPPAHKDEPPTHHELENESLRSWIYPTNLGTIRDYQFNIVSRGLFHNLLVALPTGLGKTFIAATIMLNWFRWTKSAQIVFVAPTKPLVSQQVEACFGIAGIPRSQTSMLTGGIAPGIRAEEWRTKRVFFMTPQTIVNDLKTGICDPKRVVLLVVDEAHRATGNYSYVEVVKFMRRFNQSFRVLALTATPGSRVEQVQEVINGLNIARVEIRTERSLDIRSYVHRRRSETILFDTTEEMQLLMELFSNALQPVLAKLTAQNAYWSRDPMALTPFGLTQARAKWMQSDAGRNANMGLKAMMHGIFTVLASLAHSIQLLKNHGIGPFYHTIVGFRNSVLEGGGNGSKYKKQINEDENFNKMVNLVRSWISNPDFVGHPKLEYLRDYILNHFLDAGEGRHHAASTTTTVPTTTTGTTTTPPSTSGTRVMIFAHFRDSAEEIVRVLNRSQPLVRAHVFVGQASGKTGSAGMDQKQQLSVIQQFRQGVYNTLVATSIGEEGLDIGEIDLIVCYDASASPIRMLQRMGRTGRKRAGNVLLLLMRGKEEKDSLQASDNYEKMQEMIASGAKFSFCEDLSRRILPRGVEPVVEKREVEIPVENTQAGGELPEPGTRKGKGRGKGKVPKRPPKKFHMPDGVRTGFVSAASALGGDGSDDGDDGYDGGASRRKSKGKSAKAAAAQKMVTLEPVPSLESVSLDAKAERYLSRNYQYVPGYDGETYEVGAVRLDQHPKRQRMLGRVVGVGHSRVTVALAGLYEHDDGNDDENYDIDDDDYDGSRKTRLDRWREIVEGGDELVTSLLTTTTTTTNSGIPKDGSVDEQDGNVKVAARINSNAYSSSQSQSQSPPSSPSIKSSHSSSTTPPPKRRKASICKKTPHRSHHHNNHYSGPHPHSHSHPDNSDNDKDNDDHLLAIPTAPPSSPPPTAPEMRLPSDGISLGSSSSPSNSNSNNNNTDKNDLPLDSSMAEFVVGSEVSLGVATSDGLPDSSVLGPGSVPDSSLPGWRDVLRGGRGAKSATIKKANKKGKGMRMRKGGDGDGERVRGGDGVDGLVIGDVKKKKNKKEKRSGFKSEKGSAKKSWGKDMGEDDDKDKLDVTASRQVLDRAVGNARKRRVVDDSSDP